jgi:hypothetical protein
MIVNHHKCFSDKASTKATQNEIPQLISTERRLVHVQTVVMLEDKVKGENRGLRTEHIGRGIRRIHAQNELNEKLTKGLRDFTKIWSRRSDCQTFGI